MSTSGTYVFSVSRDDIIRDAMMNIKRLDPTESPTAQETQDCARKLNMMCKQWMGKSDFAPGLKVWSRKTGYRLLDGTTGAYTLSASALGWSNNLVATTLATGGAAAAVSVVLAVAGGFTTGCTVAVELDSSTMFYTTASSVSGTTVGLTDALPSAASTGNAIFAYTGVAQKPLAIETAWLRDDTFSDYPLLKMDVQTWSALPNKQDVTDASDPTAVYWEEGLTSGTLYTDVGAAQDLSKYIVMKYMEPIQDFNNPLDEPYYPAEWFLALCWGLSEQICPMFGAQWTEKMEALKNSAMMIARNKGAETSSLYFQPGSE